MAIVKAILFMMATIPAASVKRILCLGQALTPHGSLPVSLQSRCNAALELALENYYCCEDDICILLSGSDVSKCGILEAVAMETYIREKLMQYHYNNQNEHYPNKVFNKLGFDLRLSILLETRATNTIENMIHSKALLGCQQLITMPETRAKKEILSLVTNDFHMPRALLFAQHVFNGDFDCHACIAESPQWASSIERKISSIERKIDNFNGDDDHSLDHFLELIRCEKEGIIAANKVVIKYNLTSISASSIADAIDQLEIIKESYFLRHKIRINYLGKQQE